MLYIIFEAKDAFLMDGLFEEGQSFASAWRRIVYGTKPSEDPVPSNSLRSSLPPVENVMTLKKKLEGGFWLGFIHRTFVFRGLRVTSLDTIRAKPVSL